MQRIHCRICRPKGRRVQARDHWCDDGAWLLPEQGLGVAVRTGCTEDCSASCCSSSPFSQTWSGRHRGARPSGWCPYDDFVLVCLHGKGRNYRRPLSTVARGAKYWHAWSNSKRRKTRGRQLLSATSWTAIWRTKGQTRRRARRGRVSKLAFAGANDLGGSASASSGGRQHHHAGCSRATARGSACSCHHRLGGARRSAGTR